MLYNTLINYICVEKLLRSTGHRIIINILSILTNNVHGGALAGISLIVVNKEFVQF